MVSSTKHATSLDLKRKTTGCRVAKLAAAMTLVLSLALPCGAAWATEDETEITSGFSAVALADGTDGREPSKVPAGSAAGGDSTYVDTDDSSGETELQTDGSSQGQEQKQSSSGSTTSSGSSSKTTTGSSTTKSASSTPLAKTGDTAAPAAALAMAGCGLAAVICGGFSRRRS